AGAAGPRPAPRRRGGGEHGGRAAPPPPRPAVPAPPPPPLARPPPPPPRAPPLPRRPLAPEAGGPRRQAPERAALRQPLRQRLAQPAGARVLRQPAGTHQRAVVHVLAAPATDRQRPLRRDGARPADGAGGGRDAAPRRHRAEQRRAVAVGLLLRQGPDAGEPGGGHGPRLPRRQAGMRPVPQPPLRPVEARGVLEPSRVLLGHPPAGPR